MNHIHNHKEFLKSLNSNFVSIEDILKKEDISSWKLRPPKKSPTEDISLPEDIPLQECLKFFKDRAHFNFYQNTRDKLLFRLPFDKFRHLGNEMLYTKDGGCIMKFINHIDRHGNGYRPNSVERFALLFSSQNLYLTHLVNSFETYSELYQESEVDFAMING